MVLSIVCFAVLSVRIFIREVIINPQQLGVTERLDSLRTCLTPVSPLARVATETIEASRALGRADDAYEVWDAHTETIDAAGDTPYVVFILGESTDRNKMGCYGYELPTTPYLSDMVASGEAVAFTDTIACANVTAKAMSLMLSFAEKNSPEAWYKYYNIIDVFNAAGYHTAWISNQSPSGQYGNMDAIYAGRCDESYFAVLEAAPGHYPLDSELLPALDSSLLATTAPKSFYVLHMHGDHEPYRVQYPAGFAHFTAADESGTAPEKWLRTRAEYDNAVLYTDYIVNEIIERFRDKNAVVIFVSDHGSEVYDGRDFFGHSMEELGNRHMIETPLVVWASEKFWQSKSALKSELLAAKDRPYSNENVVHFILDLAGIRSSSYDASKSILNPNNIYQTQPRIYSGRPYTRIE